MDKEEKKIDIPVIGMHCRSCEILIEDKLTGLPGVTKSCADFNKGSVKVSYDGTVVREEAIRQAIAESGYKIGKENIKTGFFSSDKKVYADLGIGALILLAFYLLLKALGFNGLNIDLASSQLTLPLVLVIGLTAGISTCMALVGGLILGVSAKYSEAHPEMKGVSKFRPHLFFNLGRVLGYAILGGVLGVVGSAFQLSPLFLGIITLGVGLVMMIMGGQLIGIFPWLENWRLTLPKSLSRFLGIKNGEGKYNDWQTSILGAMTFFLPCGFTQAMQIYAVSTGSFVRGTLIMGIFALGTAPGILSIGGLSSFVKGKAARRFFKTAGLAIILFALFNISNSLSLFGLDLKAEQGQIVKSSDPNVTLENGEQVVRMKELRSGYSPNHFTIVKDVPVKWIIDAQDTYSCASVLLMKKYKIREFLKKGENVLSFTPTEAGTIKFSCSMGMYSGSFTVIEEGGKPSARSIIPPVQAKENASVDVQKIQSTFTLKDGIKPNEFRVKAGKPVHFVVKAEEDTIGCMSQIGIPGLYEDFTPLIAGNDVTMEFTPEKKGEYPITCPMGVPHGLLIVE